MASMLYLDYSRKAGEWQPNQYGGNENLEAIAFLREVNERAYGLHPGIVTIAEESTAFPGVTRPTYLGGLGFGFKWDMGWMHDTLAYFHEDPIHRRYHHNRLTFRGLYMNTEHFVLPLSHDEVVHGKGSLLGKMPGDEWQRFANLRCLLANQFTQPGKKLLFMGSELATATEWNHDAALRWDLADEPMRAAFGRYPGGPRTAVPRVARAVGRRSGARVLRLDRCLRRRVVGLLVHPARWRGRGGGGAEPDAGAAPDYRLGVPSGGRWVEALNSDSEHYGGSNVGNLGGLDAATSRGTGSRLQ